MNPAERIREAIKMRQAWNNGDFQGNDHHSNSAELP